VLQSPARAVAVTDAGRTVGLLRIEDVEHLLTDVRREAHRPRPRPTLARPTRSEQ
jgi:hypothetical protein